ncbi:MAG: Rieske 2Fe-2S domain-containing protein [Caldilineaceae bacterium]|nr:Rieske 2Fe-2S domain-containing protein [Caldilineaceae bacterium]
MTPEKQPSRSARSQRRIPVAPLSDFPPGTRMEVKVGRTPIAVFNVDGEFFALFGRCPHQSAPLSRGRLQGTVICNADTCWETQWAHEGEVLVCPGHGMEYNVRSGKAFGYDLKLRTYEVVVEDGQVIIVM